MKIEPKIIGDNWCCSVQQLFEKGVEDSKGLNRFSLEIKFPADEWDTTDFRGLSAFICRIRVIRWESSLFTKPIRESLRHPSAQSLLTGSDGHRLTGFWLAR